MSILLLLQARGRMTAAALSDECEVSVRTIYRDVDDLSSSGVPIYSERGPSGGFQLLEGYHTRLTGLTPSEADALFLLGLPGPAADLGLAKAIAAARLKLHAALPDERRQGAERVAARFHLDPAGWYRADETTGFLAALAEGVWTNRQIDATYESWTGTSDRVLMPLGLVLKGGAWYLVAAGADDRPRTYRVSAFKSVAISAEKFDRPSAFVLADYWEQSTREFERRLFKDHAVLRVSDAGMKLLSRMAPAVGEMATATRSAVDHLGWSSVTIPIESFDHAIAELIGFGTSVEILSPPELRARMLDSVEQLRDLYSAPDGESPAGFESPAAP